MKRNYTFYLPLAFTVLVCAFLLVPVIMSVLAGLTNNYFVGLKSGLTLRWVIEVWTLYADTLWLTLLVAVASVVFNLIAGIPLAYYLAAHQSRLSEILQELITLPIAVPGLAISIGLITTYGHFSDFRSSWMFILTGHVIFTLPFMVNAILAALKSIDFKVLEEGAASLGASFWRRFVDIIVPNCMTGIVSGTLMTLTLSIGEFNLTWMLHTPLTKTLPVGLADAYASMRLEIGSAYTLIFLLLLLPLLIATQLLKRSQKSPTVTDPM
ncbi:putative ABC-type phosphate transport system,permease component [Vibrio nigripulchritudo MADA3029]|uniref:Putative ABC-type phosphate transport system, permease component n=1 Tax=Vibrio nigripulchritudo TaxID=28173 RepID=U4KGH9_9VIBR|nr:ABC transporter permease subunit [Vibrio nigripulchritudo]EGU50011.1 binding-protein-dependent transporter inner membrane component [Vibrio nigripulchritudo ATCC 27043]CCN45498.1 putative ABC-type phosphate transport system,permease component [Vibrio nigripulchritudo MADA3020]CCN55750.1 putative ABC-type phosphate transport system,permease component [Vibrio nigripulchritudo MADA3021]CCN56975.1 putative ABC-type phosphate transport system,permease component [Vibrio nigripulchritudo MADA3029]